MPQFDAAPAHREQLHTRAHHRDSFALTQMRVAEQRARHMERTGQPTGAYQRASSRSRQHFDFEIIVKYELVAGTDLLDKIERLGIASHQYVLTIVDKITRLG